MTADGLLEAAERLQCEAGRAVVIEDSAAGVDAGQRGSFGLVIGVDRGDHAEQLRDSGHERRTPGTTSSR